MERIPKCRCTMDSNYILTKKLVNVIIITDYILRAFYASVQIIQCTYTYCTGQHRQTDFSNQQFH